jgi:hypothetical protein
VHLGPRWYWHEKGYSLNSGIRVEVSGWFSDEDSHTCFAGRVAGNGFSFELASSEGYPHWADPDNRRGFRPRLDLYHHHYYRPPRAIPPWWWRYHQRPYWRHDRYWGHPRPYCPPPRYGHHPRHGYGHDRDHDRGWDGNRGRRDGRRPR